MVYFVHTKLHRSTYADPHQAIEAVIFWLKHNFRAWLEAIPAERLGNTICLHALS